MKRLQRLLSFTLIASVAWCQQQGLRQDNNNGLDDLQIVVIEGEDGANIVQDGTFAEPVVEVRDRNNLPIVGGAVVTAGVVWAVVAHTGGSTPGAFANGSNTITVTADTNGRAVISGFRPQGTGQVSIQVQASYQGHTGRVTIHQNNFPTVAAALAAGKTPGNQQAQQSNGQGNSAQNSAVQTTKAAGGGHGLLIGALVVAGAAGAAGAAYAAGVIGKKNTDTNIVEPTNTTTTPTTTSSCTQQVVNSFISADNSFASTCTTTSASCAAAATSFANAIGNFCTACGVSGLNQYFSLSAEVSSLQFFGASAASLSNLTSRCK